MQCSIPVEKISSRQQVKMLDGPTLHTRVLPRGRHRRDTALSGGAQPHTLWEGGELRRHAYVE